ncbi:hypothetical protein ACOME3_004956 [Neoechinorhynchus agilis]
MTSKKTGRLDKLFKLEESAEEGVLGRMLADEEDVYTPETADLLRAFDPLSKRPLNSDERRIQEVTNKAWHSVAEFSPQSKFRHTKTSILRHQHCRSEMRVTTARDDLNFGKRVSGSARPILKRNLSASKVLGQRPTGQSAVRSISEDMKRLRLDERTEACIKRLTKKPPTVPSRPPIVDTQHNYDINRGLKYRRRRDVVKDPSMSKEVSSISRGSSVCTRSSSKSRMDTSKRSERLAKRPPIPPPVSVKTQRTARYADYLKQKEVALQEIKKKFVTRPRTPPPASNGSKTKKFTVGHSPSFMKRYREQCAANRKKAVDSERA